jgi:hypothetical protein
MGKVAPNANEPNKSIDQTAATPFGRLKNPETPKTKSISWSNNCNAKTQIAAPNSTSTGMTSKSLHLPANFNKNPLKLHPQD